MPWRVLRGDTLTELEKKALEGQEKKARIALMEYALVYRDQRRLNAPLTLTGSDPGMLKKMDPPALVLTQTDSIDIYGPIPFARPSIVVGEEKGCCHISGLCLGVFVAHGLNGVFAHLILIR